jgi:hypothetical protein
MAKKMKRQLEKTKQNLWGPVLGALVGIAIVVAIFMFTDQAPGGSGQTAPVAENSAESPSPTQVPPVSHEDIAQVRRVDAHETKRLLDAGEAITIDVRDVQSYVAGHIPGALQIPLQYVSGEIPWFPRDKTIVTYCT